MSAVRFNRSMIAALWAAAAEALAIVHPAQAHIVPVADMVRGIQMTPAQCAALPATVWIKVSSREFCIRYYRSTLGGEGSHPVVFLQGDRLGRLNLRTGEFALGPHDKDIDTDSLARFADSLSRQVGTAAIYLARVGIDGSSGDHRIRHTTLELTVTNAALDAIKARHGFSGFHLIGQSGGSLLVGGMLALRSDIGCAVIGSGRLASNRPRRRSADPARDYFDVAEAVATIAQKRATRIMVLTDTADKKVPEPTQTGFVQLLRQAGGQAEQFIVQALDEHRHGVVGYSRIAAVGCLRNAGTQDIVAQLQKVQERRLAAKAKKDAAAAAAGAPSPAFAPKPEPSTTGAGASAR
jgi:hypothetical protein